MKKGKVIVLIMMLGVVVPSSQALSNYDEELRNQVQATQKKYELRGIENSYFFDMGILARRADEAQYDQLTSEIVGVHLFKKMDDHIRSELKEIKRLYLRDPYKASTRLEDLARYKRFYQPTGEYLSTTGGQALGGEIARARKVALTPQEGDQMCTAFVLESGLKAVRKTGAFVTNRPEEIKSMRELQKEVDCCIRWKSKINYYSKNEFETDYESGFTVEEGTLKLKSSPRNLSEATWEGKWVYTIAGREGTAEGVSNAVLKYRKGEDVATLKITHARVNSAGRINLPIAMAGDRRTLDVEGDGIRPEILFTGGFFVPLTGCQENKITKE